MQIMAFSATYTPELLADLDPFMKRPQRVMMCDDVGVGLIGIQQYYKLVLPNGLHGQNLQLGSKDDSSLEQDAAEVEVEEVGGEDGLRVSAENEGARSKDGSGGGGGTAAASEQSDMLDLKVKALLQVLETVSFHQVSCLQMKEVTNVLH